MTLPESDDTTGLADSSTNISRSREASPVSGSHSVKRKGKTKAQVKDKLREVVEDLEAGVRAEARYTVKDAVDDFFDKGLKGKSKATMDNYRSLAAHHLIPQIGTTKLQQLTADQLDEWIDERAEELSTRSLRLIHQILERAIRQAQARDKVRRNVATLIMIPEGKQGHPSKAMTLDQAIRLLEALESETDLWLAAYVVLSLLTGLRTEEARALTWAEVDLQAGTVAVYRSVRTKGDTKTRKSRRILKLPTKAVHTQRTHYTHQATQRREAADTWHDHDLVFCREDGTPLDRWQVRRKFQKITQTAGLGADWTPRELRHSFVSILSNNGGVWIEDISDLMGHSGTSVTETVYRHEIRPALTKAATAMNKILKTRQTSPRQATSA
jgi:integrase